MKPNEKNLPVTFPLLSGKQAHSGRITTGQNGTVTERKRKGGNRKKKIHLNLQLGYKSNKRLAGPRNLIESKCVERSSANHVFYKGAPATDNHPLGKWGKQVSRRFRPNSWF